MDERGQTANQRRSRAGTRLGVLRGRDFRLLWSGELLSTVGSQMQLFAVNWQVLQLAGSRSITLSLAGVHLGLRADALALGTLGFVRVLPTLLLALLGGVVADTRDRRAVITVAQLAATVVAGTLAAVSFSGHAGIAVLYLLSAAGTAAAAFAQPAQQALVPRLVPRGQLANAYSLYALLWQVGTLAGPPLAGLAIARAGFGVVYAVNAASFLAVVAAVRAMRLPVRGPAPEEAERATRGRGTLGEGWRFARATPLIWQTLLIDLYATFFGSARGMVPLVAARVLHLGVEGYGLLATAQPVGAFLSGAVLTLRREMRHEGRVLLASVAIFGAAWAAFGLLDVLALSYLAYAASGAADTVSYVIRTTIRQALTPDALRGRVAGVHLVLGDAGPEFGELEAGILAALAGAPAAIVAGGVATVVATGWAAWRWPELRAYRGSAVRDERRETLGARS